MSVRARRLFTVAISTVVVSCSSSSSTTGGATDGGDDATIADSGPHPLSTLDDVCDAGPTGKQLMAFVRSTYAGTYTPPGSRPSAPPWKGSTTPSALSLAVVYAGGAIVCTPAFHPNCPAGAPCAAPRPPEISVDLALTFTTADGTLKESLVATARWSSVDSSVNWSATLPATKIAGSYPISGGTPAEVRLFFSGRFQGDKNDGNVSEMTSTLSFDGGAWTSTAGAADAGGP